MSDNQVIPEAAVEAAAKCLYERDLGVNWDGLRPSVKRGYLDDARAALEAAAPHMLADVWDSAIEAHKAWTWDDENFDALVNPYRPTT